MTEEIGSLRTEIWGDEFDVEQEYTPAEFNADFGDALETYIATNYGASASKMAAWEAAWSKALEDNVLTIAEVESVLDILEML